MCKSPAALYRPKKEKQTKSREKVDERPSATKRILTLLFNKFL
jgi:hypothetical protein